MTQLTVSIEDVSMLDQIKQAISLLRGVTLQSGYLPREVQQELEFPSAPLPGLLIRVIPRERREEDCLYIQNI
jgi:hypothetical protein